MNSRGYPKGNKNREGYNENVPGNRNANDNYFPESSRNYNTSREMQSGVFANELKKIKKDIPVEIEEVVGYSGSKARVGSKRTFFERESRDDRFHGSEVSSQQNVERIVERQMENMRLEIYENVSEVMKEQGAKYDKALLELVTQINTALKKKQENFYSLRLDTNHLQESFTKLASNFQLFSKENQEKLQTLVNEMGTLTGTKKSKAYGDYGVDLKNSFQGLNSSISVNLGNQTSNSKLVNEVIFQLDALKRDVSDSKMQIEEMNLRLLSKIKEVPVESTINNSKAETFLKQDILACIEKKIKEERKSWKMQERMDNLQAKWVSLHEILQKQEDNIFGMNEELKNTINNQMNPKIKKIESSIIDIYSKIDPLMFDNQIREGIARQLSDRLKDCKLLKVRSPTASQSSRINSITGMNAGRITSNETYLVDEEHFLMDSEGCYLTETINGQRSRVRVQQNMIYLLGLKGIQVSNCC